MSFFVQMPANFPKKVRELLKGRLAMNIQQKSRVRQLRIAGKSYVHISIETHLPIGTIKAFCSRNDIKEYQDSIQYCACCGVILVRTPKHRTKRFCSDECRYRWWGSNRDKQIKKGNVCVCSQCGAEYSSYRNTSRFCSHPCYIAHRFGKGEGQP